jgi:uncharacterized protein YndB with AHSA1/START domain
MRVEILVSGAALALAAASASTASGSDRVLRAEVTVRAPLAEAWKAWTTDAGIATFFAPEGHVDLVVDGAYDVWFNPTGKPGMRGAEGMRILDVDPMKRFAFTWNAPPTIPSIRGKRTVVVLEFAPSDESTTRMRFTQLGWGDGPDWDEAFDYFDQAWGALVLPRLVHRFEKGPIDWKAPPTLARVDSTLKRTLAAAAH